MKQTSIEWLVEQLLGKVKDCPDGIIEKSKQMHKQEIIEFAEKYEEYVSNSVNNNRYIQVKSAQQYYQETFKKD